MMSGIYFLYIGAAMTGIWGISHLFPTKNVVSGFGDIIEDNRFIVKMGWIVEGVFLIFIGVLVAIVTYIDPLTDVSRAVFFVSSAGLLILALVSLFTGFKVGFLPFKLCPFIFTASAVLILLGAF
jgi:hypothetical protein